MKFLLSWASNSWTAPYEVIEINSLEELIEFVKGSNHEVILSATREDNVYYLTIYDDYIE